MTARTGFVCAVAAVLLLLAGCSTPLPPERAAYAGVWRNGATMLAISPQGRVIYRVERGNGFRKSIEAPIQRFEGDNVVIGLGPISTTFVVSALPKQQPEGHWTMTVDGVELTRE
ncbi:MAG TPA: hypothetical protein VLF18_21405 [Tahibacter sp.]|uniref:hypothetical protein n=1 Tax=Tahibacter sp. TaxID=2056211 RepID=UPI002CCAF1A9|nr:hypothetical protein [Tahibacter sp.]HSX62748.1 hypothetical protein [Tahibacter sp.]